MIGSELAGVVGDQRALSWQDFADEVEKVRRGVTFDIELDFEHLLKVADVAVSDVARVGTRVNGDAVCAVVDGALRRAGDARGIRTTAIAQQGDFVHVYTQASHRFDAILQILKSRIATRCATLDSAPLTKEVM